MMYNVKKKLKISIILLVLLIPSVLAVQNTTIREGNCLATETFLLTQYTQNNSHLGQLGYYNYSLCYPLIKTITLRDGICNADEDCLLSQYKHNNSHIADCNYYNYSLCAQDSSLTYLTNNSCRTGEISILTQYQQNNSHIADLNYFNYTLCHDVTSPEISFDTISNIITSASMYNVSLNYTATDNAGIENTWYNLSWTGNSRNVSISYNTTFLLPYDIYGNYNLTLYTQDIYGNINQTSQIFSATYRVTQGSIESGEVPPKPPEIINITNITVDFEVLTSNKKTHYKIYTRENKEIIKTLIAKNNGTENITINIKCEGVNAVSQNNSCEWIDFESENGVKYNREKNLWYFDLNSKETKNLKQTINIPKGTKEENYKIKLLFNSDNITREITEEIVIDKYSFFKSKLQWLGSKTYWKAPTKEGIDIPIYHSFVLIPIPLFVGGGLLLFFKRKKKEFEFIQI